MCVCACVGVCFILCGVMHARVDWVTWVLEWNDSVREHECL